MSLDDLQAGLDRSVFCPRPIFVLGAPRSGTHGLAFALGAHSELWTHSESEVLFHLFGKGAVDEIFHNAEQRVLPTWVRMFQVGKAELYAHLGLGLNVLFTSRNPGKRWIDKTPQYSLMGEILLQMFPGAQFLHILRDGRRVVHSMMHFLDRFCPEAREKVVQSGQVQAWATDFREACRTWRQYVEAAARFCAAHPDRCRTVINEQLMAAPEQGLRELFAFLGVAEEAEPIRFFRSHRINSSFQEARPDLPSPENLGRPFHAWGLDQATYFLDQRPYQDRQAWNEWPPEWKETFVAEAGELLVELGFANATELDRWRRGEAEAPPAAADEAPAPQPPPEEVSRDRARAAAVGVVPANAAVLVVDSVGDNLLRLPGRFTFRYPLKYLPADSDQAIAHLESLRRQGAGFLLFPGTELWWFERYPELRRHLDANYHCLHNSTDCMIFQLS
jgi:hypothetical protein